MPVKLKEYSPETVVDIQESNRIPRIGYSKTSGQIRFNLGACTLIGLVAGDLVKFFEDENSKGDWYLEKVKEGGFVLTEINQRSKGLQLCSKALGWSFYESVAAGKPNGKMSINPASIYHESRQLWALNTEIEIPKRAKEKSLGKK